MIAKEVTLFVTSDTRHLPYLMQGLVELERIGDIKLRVLSRGPRVGDRIVITGQEVQRVRRPYPWSYRMEIRDPRSCRVVRVGVDLQDWENFFSYGDIKSCDLLFKRSYNARIANLLQAKFGTLVLPAGMTYGVKFPRGDRRVPLMIASVFGKIESLMTHPTRAVGWMRERIAPKMVLPLQTCKTIDNFINPSLAPKSQDYAFFQVQCHGSGGWREAEELNKTRADLIRALRSGVGEAFMGGMYFDGPPRREFADCLSVLPTARDAYLRLVANAAVVVATNGFGQSVPWKLCEYLSLGKCVVAEELAVGLPVPLVHGREMYFFKNHAECVQQCMQLLVDPDARERMGQRARQYYLEHVASVAAARRYIETALGLATNRSLTIHEAKA
jgi:hypothetical protein